jgi:hypothetical protein
MKRLVLCSSTFGRILPAAVRAQRAPTRPRTKRSTEAATLSGEASLRKRAHCNAMNLEKRSRIRRSSLAFLPGKYGLESCRCTMTSKPTGAYSSADRSG